MHLYGITKILFIYVFSDITFGYREHCNFLPLLRVTIRVFKKLLTVFLNKISEKFYYLEVVVFLFKKLIRRNLLTVSERIRSAFNKEAFIIVNEVSDNRCGMAVFRDSWEVEPASDKYFRCWRDKNFWYIKDRFSCREIMQVGRWMMFICTEIS